MIPTLTREDLAQASDPRALIRQTFSCHHPHIEMVKRSLGHGWVRLVMQCRRCGGLLTVPTTDTDIPLTCSALLCGLPDYDEKLGRDWVTAEIACYTQLRELREAAGQRDPGHEPALSG